MLDNLDKQYMVNTDPREHKENQATFYERTYSREKRRGNTVWTLVVVFVFLVIVGTGLSFWGLMGPMQTAVLPEHIFSVAGHTQLVVKNREGKIHIHAGNTNSIVVQATKYARGIGASVNDSSVRYEQQGDIVSVTGDENWNFVGERGINMDITVPNTTDLQIKSTASDIGIEQISGNIQAQTVSGDIEGSVLDGTVKLFSTSGGIKLDTVNGTMTLSTISGDIEAHTIQLHGQSSIKSTSGGITLEGSLDQQGQYRMETVSGDIDLTLPTNAAFQLNAATTSGDVSNGFGKTTVGNAPQPVLTLNTTSGGIEINKR